MDRVRGATLEKLRLASEESGTSGMRSRLTPLNSAQRPFTEEDPGSSPSHDATLAAELEAARAELRRKERELEALKSTLELTREENVQLRDSLRCVALSGPTSLAPPVAPPERPFELELDLARLAPAPPSATGARAEASAGAASLALDSRSRLEQGRAAGNESDEYPVLRNVVLSASSEGTAPASDRRGSLRHACDIEIEFADETHFFAGLTQDISHGGLFVTTYHLLPVGSQLSLRFELPDGTQIEALGQVRWVIDADSDSRPGLGIEFVEPSADMLRSIAAFCATRPPLYFDTSLPPTAS